MILDTPIEYQRHQGYLEVKHEEDALCWFWAFPKLMPWPRRFLWLYTPVVGNKKWPGDLWGIDSRGELLIVECKKCKRWDDPFIDFRSYHRSGRPELSAEHWKWKFRKHLKAELASCDCLMERPKGKTGGILPRSNKRKHIRRWPKLGRIIDSYIRSPEYRDRALNYLQVRANRRDPTPFYLALMAVSDPKSPIMSERAIASGRKLQQKVGGDHVRVIAVEGVLLPDNKVRITAKEIPWESGRGIK